MSAIFHTHKEQFSKTIYILGFAIYKRNIHENKIKFYFFNIPVWKKIYDNGKVKHYFLGIRIANFRTDRRISSNRRTANFVYSVTKMLFGINRVLLKGNEKIRIHFLYIADSYWPSWDSLYTACLQDVNIETKIIFLNTRKTKLFTSQYENAESFLKEHNIPYVEYEDYFPEQEKPHIMIYQSPYNTNYDVFRKVSPDFITGIGIRVVYVSYGIEYDRSVNNDHIQNLHYTHLVHSLAWRIFVAHKDIKNEFYKYCPTGGFHVCISGHPKFDSYTNQKFDLPHDLIHKAKGRKIVAFQIHCYNDSDCIGLKRIHSIQFAEHKRILKLLQSYNNYLFVYTIHPAFKTRNIDKKFCTSNDYSRFISAIQNADNTYLYSGNHQALLAKADVFITENSSLMIEMGYFNKPVLYLYDRPVALKPFAEELAMTFHHGHTYQDVANFMDLISLRQDDFLNLRKDLRESIFPHNIYNGKIGFRIKEYILQQVKNEK